MHTFSCIFAQKYKDPIAANII